MNATIIHVAEAAGVSIKSVSRVINGEPHVSAKLRERVERAMRDLNYAPNVAARSLAGTRSFAIAMLFDNPSPAYVMKVLEGAYAVSQRMGHQLVLENIDTGGGVDGAMAHIVRRRVDGMILTPPACDNAIVLDHLEGADIPYVRIGPSSFPGRSRAVGMDDEAAAAEIASILLQQGHRTFGIINGPDAIAVSTQRRAGFLRILGSQADARWREAAGAFTFLSGLEAGRQLLAQSDPPTAILCANDDMAAGLYAAAGERGFTIPDNLSVAGFDDSWIAESVWPPLTTVHQPIARMAGAAVTLLLDRRGESAMELQSFPFRLIHRGSIGPARALFGLTPPRARSDRPGAPAIVKKRR